LRVDFGLLLFELNLNEVGYKIAKGYRPLGAPIVDAFGCAIVGMPAMACTGRATAPGTRHLS
jgi:hypothetical protein